MEVKRQISNRSDGSHGGMMRARPDTLTPQEITIEDVKKADQKKIETDEAWDRDPIDVIAKKLNTSIDQGLTSEEAAKRLKEDGPNELWKPKAPGLAMLFLMQLLNIIILLLSASSVASIVIQATGDKRDDPISYVEGIAIFTIVILNAGIAAVTENDANNALEALSKMSQPMAKVRRDGQDQDVKSAEVVRGDIVILGTGDIVSADVRLIESSELKVNEMLLTGEPDDVAKTSKVKVHSGGPAKLTPDTMAFSSCTVTNGKATAIVTQTGMKTRVGAIAGMLMQEQPTKCGCLPDTSASQTALQFSLQKL
jgi:magnesium-transporting ATPase (P-type)